MSLRLAFAIGALSLILGAANMPPQEGEEGPPQKETRLHSQPYARPGSSVAIHCLQRDEQDNVLAIRMHRPDDPALARAFVEFPSLKSLSIMDGEFTEDAFRTVENLKHLEELVLIHRHRQFTGRSLADVAKVPALRRLRLKATSIGNDDVVHLEKHPQLAELHIGNTEVGDLGVEHIARLCPRLRELDVSDLAITNRTARAIAQLSKLQTLDISNTSIGDDGLAALATLPDLQSLSLTKTTTDAGIAEVGKMKSLRTLFIYYTKVTDAGVAHLAGLHNLETLVLICHDGVTDDSLVHLASLTRLKKLRLSSNDIEGHGLIHLNGLPKLDSLDIDGYHLLGRHLSKIVGHTSLRGLDAGHTSFEAREDFEVLKQFKSLQYIEAALSLEQVKELQEALPDCLIHSP